MIDQIKIRKLDNGFTVKMHVQKRKPGAAQPLGDAKGDGYSVQETYIRDVADLKVYIGYMIDKHGMEFEQIENTKEW